MSALRSRIQAPNWLPLERSQLVKTSFLWVASVQHSRWEALVRRTASKELFVSITACSNGRSVWPRRSPIAFTNFYWSTVLASYFFSLTTTLSSVTDGVAADVLGSFSLLQRPGSWANLYSGWAAGKLTRAVLRDYNLDLSPDSILSTTVPLDFGSTERSNFSSRCSIVRLTTTGPTAESHSALVERATVLAAASSSSSSRVISGTTRSRTPRCMEKPLAASQSRGVGDGNGSGLLLTCPPDTSIRTVAGTGILDTPMVLPIRGHLDQIRRLMKGDFYIGRGASQRGLRRSAYSNSFKVSEYGREVAISKFAEHLKMTPVLRRRLWSLSGLRLVCHCRPEQQCHADSIISEFKTQFPTAYNRDDPASPPPDSRTLNYLAVLREEPLSDEGSTADEGVSFSGIWMAR